MVGSAAKSDATRTRRTTGLLLDPSLHTAILIAACLLTYWNSMQVPFTFDDYIYILENPLIQSFSSFWGAGNLEKTIIHRDVICNFALRPVTYFTFAVNYMLTGASPGGMHLLNNLIHTVNALLAYFVTRMIISSSGGDLPAPVDQTSRSFISFFSAMLFAIHPIQTEAVTYIVQRFTSLVALFYLLTLLLYLLYRCGRSNWTRVMYYLLALVAAIAAMKTKENAFTLPLMILMVELFFFRGEIKKRLAFLVPFAMIMPIIPLTVARLSAAGNGDNFIVTGTNLVNYGGYATGDYLITQIRVLVTYLRLLIFPVNQNLDYDFPLLRNLMDYRILLSLTLLLLLAGAALWLLKLSYGPSCRDPLRVRLLSFGIFWFFITISVESSIIPLEDLIVEHRLYLPSLGIILSVVSGVDFLRVHPVNSGTDYSGVAAAFLATIAIILSVATIKRNDQWKNIWEDVVQKSPGKVRPLQNLGISYFNAGRHDEAIPCFKKVISMQQNNLKAHLDLAISLTEKKRYVEAGEELALVLTKEPQNVLALEALGIVHLMTRDYRNAVKRLQQSLALKPDNSRARSNLGLALARLEGL